MESEIQKLRFTRTPNLETGNPQEKKAELIEYLRATSALYEKLFEVVKDKKSLLKKPDPLRRPLIFYLGHTAAFFINKLILPGNIPSRVNPKLESMLADDVDEMDWDDNDESHFEWPSYEEIMEYRAKVRETLEKAIESWTLTLPITFGSSPFWTLIMGIEYERLHFETTSVLIRRLPAEEVQDHALFPICQEINYSGYDDQGNPKVDDKFPRNEILTVPEGTVELNKRDGYYGWDNQFGTHTANVKQFGASKFLASNYEFWEFMQAGGYTTEKYWTEEGWKWCSSKVVEKPLFWMPDKVVNGKQTYKYRTLTKVIDMPWDWPVEVNFHEAKAFCNWKSEVTGKPIRLLSEEEYYRIRDNLKGDQPNWEFGKVGNINLEYAASSCPVNKFSINGFYDVVGNVWQHTETLLDKWNGFRVFWLVDDFSTTKFDMKHNVMKGGSWASTGNLATYYYRAAFRRHFYQYAGIRYVESNNPVVNRTDAYETDSAVSQYLEFHYGDRVYFGVPNFPQKCAELCVEVCKANGVKLGRALDLGCSVGRSTFELAKLGFQEVIGIDLSARFFQMAFKFRELQKLHYKMPIEGDIQEDRVIDLVKLGLQDVKDRVKFYQGDASNLNAQKLGKFDLVFGGNLLCRMKVPRKLLLNVHEFLNPGGIFILVSPCTWLTDFTDKEEWIGGYVKKDGTCVTTYQGIKSYLQDRFVEIKEPHEVEFVIRETGRKFQHSFSQATYWKKKD